jgi:16S rRNA G966 N2-methylase RsmD
LIESVSPESDHEKAEARRVFIDPPYNVAIDGHHRR